MRIAICDDEKNIRELIGSGTYKSNGKYNNTLSELVSKKVDEEV